MSEGGNLLVVVDRDLRSPDEETRIHLRKPLRVFPDGLGDRLVNQVALLAFVRGDIGAQVAVGADLQDLGGRQNGYVGRGAVGLLVLCSYVADFEIGKAHGGAGVVS